MELIRPKPIKNVTERLDDNLAKLSEKDNEIIKEKYINEMNVYFPQEPIIIGNNSDLTKRYEKIFVKNRNSNNS